MAKAQPKAKVKAGIRVMARDQILDLSGSWVSKMQTEDSYTEGRFLP